MLGTKRFQREFIDCICSFFSSLHPAHAPSRSSPHRRQSFSLASKMAAIRLAREVGVPAVAGRLGVYNNLVSSWCANEDRLFERYEKELLFKTG